MVNPISHLSCAGVEMHVYNLLSPFLMVLGRKDIYTTKQLFIEVLFIEQVQYLDRPVHGTFYEIGYRTNWASKIRGSGGIRTHASEETGA